MALCGAQAGAEGACTWILQLRPEKIWFNKSEHGVLVILPSPRQNRKVHPEICGCCRVHFCGIAGELPIRGFEKRVMAFALYIPVFYYGFLKSLGQIA